MCESHAAHHVTPQPSRGRCFSAAPRHHPDGHRSLLCQATRFVPNSVRYNAGRRLTPRPTSTPVRRGLVPSALHDLVTARRKVKALMKAHRDDPNTPASQHAVWNARQLALKVSANALYGFTGAPASPLCCGPLAESCIFHGATLCQTARVFIETEGASALLHGVAGGPRLHRPPRVIYGQVCVVASVLPVSK